MKPNTKLQCHSKVFALSGGVLRASSVFSALALFNAMRATWLHLSAPCGLRTGCSCNAKLPNEKLQSHLGSSAIGTSQTCELEAFSGLSETGSYFNWLFECHDMGVFQLSPESAESNTLLDIVHRFCPKIPRGYCNIMAHRGIL